MFVVCFGDGLGNQMFQYAFYLALKNNYPENNVYMDIFRIYGNYIHNGFELEKIFNIKTNEVRLNEALKLSEKWPNTSFKYKVGGNLQKIRKAIFGPKESYICQDDPTGFYHSVFELNETKSYIFNGNWVNEKYFKDIKDEVIEAFTFPKLETKENIKMQKMMNETNSVSVHIRKGDYLNSQMLNLDLNYYIQAKEEIEKRIKNPQYFLFSDEKESINEYKKLFQNAVIVEGNCGADSFRDMQLMSCCKHNIIANSTFSFWGAYLNKNVSKIVVAPDKAKYDFRHPFACEDWCVIPYLGKK